MSDTAAKPAAEDTATWRPLAPGMQISCMHAVPGSRKTWRTDCAMVATVWRPIGNGWDLFACATHKDDMNDTQQAHFAGVRIKI